MTRVAQSRWLGVLAVLVPAFFLIASSSKEDAASSSGYVGAPDWQCSMVQATDHVSSLTGPESPTRTDERWNVYGTDLGISFEMDGDIYMAFGDTWGRDGVEGVDWRSNTLATIEPDPAHGYVVTDMISGDNGEAYELLAAIKQSTIEYTVNPTAAIAVDDRMYMHYISVNDWDQKWWGYKHPVPNGSGLAYSDDQGKTWIKDERAIWIGDTPFAQAAMVKDGGYVYIYGTQAGRFGNAHLMRVDEEHLLEPDKYEYWAGDDWTSNPWDLAVLLPGPVGELSVQWSEYHERWLMMYTNEIHHTIVLRTAERLEGPWDEERVVATAEQYPSLYAPFMLPEIEGPEVYFTMSVFDDVYQVFLMRFTLDQCL